MAYVYASPALLLIAVFVYAPVAHSLALSFSRWNLMTPDQAFVGVANYQRLATMPEFWNALGNTGLYVLGTVPTTLVLGLLLAVLIETTGPLRPLWRSVYFLPAASTFIAMTIVWQWLFHPSLGLINQSVQRIGLHGVAWLDDPRSALWALVLVGVWHGTGYTTVLYLAGLGNVPRESREAAAVDGATPVQTFWRVTLPLLTPTTLFALIVSVIRSAQMFDLAKVMTEGGPVRSTEVLVYFIWQQAFQFFDVGLASAVACVLFALLLLATIAQMRLFASQVHYQ